MEFDTYTECLWLSEVQSREWHGGNV